MRNSVAGAVHFDAELIRRYDGRGPRYTSYPTALEFSPDVGIPEYTAALANRSIDTPLSVYVHIPFCRSLCYYCGCNKIVTRNESRVAGYLQTLHTEIDLQASLVEDGARLRQLHFGGGTPTWISDTQLAALLTALDAAFPFAAATEREFSIEIDPRTVAPPRMRELAGMGFNRISLGVQDFDPAVQAAVNRRQSVEQITELVAAARDSAVDSVSFDLIYGLPLQTAVSFSRTLAAVLAIRPDRLAVYNYAHLPQRFRGQRMIDTNAIPGAAEKLEILRTTIETLTGAGYEYIGMDHFALPDDELAIARRERTLARNFQGYSTNAGCDLIGLGVSAIGSVGDCLVQNTTSTADYAARIADGRLPLVRGLQRDADDRLRAAVIRELMCFDALNFADFDRRHDLRFTDYFADELLALQTLADDGLVRIDTGGITIAPRGRLLLRPIAMIFDRYLQAAREAYSRVV